MKTSKEGKSYSNKAKRFADRIHQTYLVNLTHGKAVTVTTEDAKEIENYVATLRREGVDVTKDLVSNANKHHRMVVDAKKKAHFYQDVPAPSYLEDGDWEDSQLYAAWAAKYDPEGTVRFTTWLLIHTAWRSRAPALTERPELAEVVPSSVGVFCRVMPLPPRLEALVGAKREDARQSRLSDSSLQSVPIHHTTTITHHDFCRLDGWLGDGVLNEYLNMLVRSLAPLTTVNLGSYFMAMTNPNQRGGILRQKGVNLMEMDLALLPLNVTRSHWILYAIQPKFKLVSFFNSFNNDITDEDDKVREWIAEQVGRQYVAEEWVIQQMLSPIQTDAEACGVFVCMNAYCVFIGRDPRQVYAQEHIQQLRNHVGAVILNAGYVGELQMNGIGPVGTTPLDPAYNAAKSSLTAPQNRTGQRSGPGVPTEEAAADKEVTASSRKSQQRGGMASKRGGSERGRGQGRGRSRGQGRGVGK